MFSKNIRSLILTAMFFTYIVEGYYSATYSYSYKSIENVRKELEPTLKFLRINESALIGFMVLEFFSFLELEDNISPFIDIFYQVFSDIKYFCVILSLYALAFSNCFWLLSKNQTTYDGANGGLMTKKESDQIPYKTATGSIWYVWFLILGQPDVSGFSIGEHSMEIPLLIVFCICAFIMLIHLLNMLIAIMGNTYAERSAISAQIRTRDHLTFVINNWHLSECAFGKPG